MKTTPLLIIGLALCACTDSNQAPAYKDASKPIEERVSDLLGRMDLHEKVMQLNQYVTGENTNINNLGTSDGAIPAEIGSLLFQSGGPEDHNRLQKDIIEQSRLGIPTIFGYDVIHGYRSLYAVPLAQACSFNPDMSREASRMAAREAVLSGIDWTFSPMIDVARDPRWGRVVEGYGEDPYMNARFGVAAVEGYQGENPADQYSIAACLKHYVGYGVSEGGRDYRYTDISQQALWETYLKPYEACVKAGALTLMSAFNDISGVPASANKYTLRDILKEKWGHKGFVVSDWDAVMQLVYQGVAADNEDAAIKAFTAGVEMDMKDDLYGQYLEAAVNDGRVPMALIDDAVARILRVKFQLGLFENPYVPVLPEEERYLQPKDIEICENIAEEAIVLLKNDASILPLSGAKKLAIIGPTADDQYAMMGSWRGHARPEDVTTILSAFKASQANIAYAKGCDFDQEIANGIAEARKVAASSDVVILCLGESAFWSGENATRSTIKLPQVQHDLLNEVAKTGKPIVLVLANGRPLDLSDMEPKAQAIVELWQPGIVGGTPLVKVLNGDVNPSGRLAITFPRSTGQIPIYYNMRQAARPFGGQGNYQDISTEPFYPFGYGLSYTTFAYSDLKIVGKADDAPLALNKPFTVEVTVSNTGNVDGKEPVLMFVTDPACSITRPMKELRNFCKPLIKAGTSETISFEVDPMRDLAYVDQNGNPLLEAGEFRIQIGDQKISFMMK